MHLSSAITLALTLWAGTAHSWGGLGHRTVALLAEKQLSPEGALFVRGLLDGETIDDAAVWPDDYKTTPAGKYTYTWHFIDSHDNPPTSCIVNYKTDCDPAHVCIISAIKNMVSRTNL